LLESLESRQLLSTVTLTGGILTVQADNDRTNMIEVSVNGTNKKTTVSLNGVTTNFRAVPSVKANVFGGNMDDAITLNVKKMAGRNVGIGLVGAGGNDLIVAMSDTRVDMTGSSGNDTLVSGASGDFLQGDDGDDLLIGGDGNDFLTGGPGHNVILAGKGDDSIVVLPYEPDYVDGGRGFDTIYSYGDVPIAATYKNVERISLDGTGLG
jgi:Ca2+-binding RTX toxin-like protein